MGGKVYFVSQCQVTVHHCREVKAGTQGNLSHPQSGIDWTHGCVRFNSLFFLNRLGPKPREWCHPFFQWVFLHQVIKTDTPTGQLNLDNSLLTIELTAKTNHQSYLNFIKSLYQRLGVGKNKGIALSLPIKVSHIDLAIACVGSCRSGEAAFLEVLETAQNWPKVSFVHSCPSRIPPFTLNKL